MRRGSLGKQERQTQGTSESNCLLEEKIHRYSLETGEVAFLLCRKGSEDSLTGREAKTQQRRHLYKVISREIRLSFLQLG